MGSDMGFYHSVTSAAGDILSSVLNSTTNYLLAKLGATENHIGQVGGAMSSISLDITRPSDTTLYTNLDNVGRTTLTVTGATNASPIVITTSANHGLVDGDVVTNSGIGGNTNANGNYFSKLVSPTTYSLYTDKALTVPRAGNSAYTSGGSVFKLFRLTGMARVAGGSGLIAKLFLHTNVKTVTAVFKMHIFNAPATAIADNAEFGVLYADRAAKVGEALFPAMTTEGTTASDSARAILTPGSGNLALAYQCAAGDTDLYFALELISGAFTPTSGQLFYIKVSSVQN